MGQAGQGLYMQALMVEGLERNCVLQQIYQPAKQTTKKKTLSPNPEIKRETIDKVKARFFAFNVKVYTMFLGPLFFQDPFSHC